MTAAADLAGPAQRGPREEHTPAAGRSAARKSVRRREELGKWAFLLPALTFMALFFGYPVVKNVTMSFQEYTTSTFYTG